MIPDRFEATSALRQRADAWFTPGRFALLLGLLLVCSFPGVVFGLETFYMRDFSVFGLPVAFFQRESFWHGQFPLWNPYNCCGLPFLAQWNTAALYPPSLLYVLLPLSWSLGVFCLGHLFFAGLGMYFLAHQWTANRFAATVAGMVFAFNGLTWCALIWTSNLAALAWMPWVVLAMAGAWRTGGRRILLAGLAAAMQILTGSPEAILMTWLVVAALAAMHLWRGDFPRRRVWSGLLLALGLAFALGAAQLLPFYDLLTHSSRDSGYAASLEEAQWAMPGDGWANFLVPLYHCLRAPFGMYYQTGQAWTNSYFLGIGTVALATFALCRPRRDWRTWLLAGVAGFGLVMALGDHGGLYTWLKLALPVLGFMRYPVKFVILATFALPLLAGQALAWLPTLRRNERAAAGRRIFCLAAALPAVMGLIVWQAWVHPSPGEERLVTLQNAVVRLVFLALIAGALALTFRAREFKLQLLLRAGLLLCFWLDVFTHSPGLNPTVERSVYQPDEIREFFNQQAPGWDAPLRLGKGRAMMTQKSYTGMTYRSAGDAAADITGRRLSLFADLNLLDQIPKTDGFFSIELREPHSLFARIALMTNDLPGLEDFLGVARISDPTNAVGWLTRDTFLPLITAGQQPVFVNDETALDAVTDRRFDPARTVYLPPDAQPFITATNVVRVQIASRKSAAQNLEAETESPAPAMVVVAQSFYHPWHAYVDGRPVKLWRANYAFQALEVPAGRHQVRLVYEDKAFLSGAGISLAALGFCGFAWLWGRKRSPA